MANGRFTLQLMDYGREKSSMSVETGAVTAVSLPGLLTQIGTFRTATEAITLGVVTNERLTVFDTRLANTPPTDVNAQRERQWLVTYEDTTEFFDAPINAIPNEGYRSVHTLSIPTAEFTGRLLTNTEFADLAQAQIAAWITAFEAMGRSPYGGAVNVLNMEAVGRNL